MKKLTMIDLSYNRIEELDNRIFMENPALLELDLSGNKFMSFSDKPLILSDSLKVIIICAWLIMIILCNQNFNFRFFI